MALVEPPHDVLFVSSVIIICFKAYFEAVAYLVFLKFLSSKL